MIGRYYVQYFNHQYKRTGTLWEGRYKATLIDSEQYLLTCYRYIELNPVRAGMVNHRSEYPWSSFAYNALGQFNQLIQPHLLYKSLGGNVSLRAQNYLSLFDKKIPEYTLLQIREATNKAWVLGSEKFKQQIENKISRPASPRKRGGNHRKNE